MLRLRNDLVLAAAAAFALSSCTTVARVMPAPVVWTPVDAATGRITDLPQLEALAIAFPESASVQRRLLSAAVRNHNSAVALTALHRLEAMGYALRPQSFEALAPLIGEAEANASRERAEAMGRQIGTSTVLATLLANHRLVEGVAFDPLTRRLYASSIVDRQLLRIDGIQVTPVPGVDGGSLSGLAVDAERRLLWIGSGVVEPTPSAETAFRGLIAVDLDGTVPVRRLPAPEGVSLGDIGLAPGGSVYASDPVGGGLYRLRAGAEAIETLVAPGTLRSPQGIAVHPSGRWLYVADYSYGIAIVDTRTGVVGRLAAAQTMMLDGTDGLLWFESGLVAIQNGTSPLRIVRIALDPSGTPATGLDVIEANHPDWGEPTLGAINGNSLIYVSDPQWDRFGAGGEVKGDQPLRPNRVRLTPLK